MYDPAFVTPDVRRLYDAAPLSPIPARAMALPDVVEQTLDDWCPIEPNGKAFGPRSCVQEMVNGSALKSFMVQKYQLYPEGSVIERLVPPVIAPLYVYVIVVVEVEVEVAVVEVVEVVDDVVEIVVEADAELAGRVTVAIWANCTPDIPCCVYSAHNAPLLVNGVAHAPMPELSTTGELSVTWNLLSEGTAFAME